MKSIKNIYWKYRNKIINYLRGYDDTFEFPFDVNKPMPKGAEKVMQQCCLGLEKMNIRYFVTDGTALGLYRENRFIPHDNDIDVDIVDADKLEQIEDYFENVLKMHLGRKLLYKGKIQQLIYYTDDEIIFDMVFWHKCKEGYEVRYPEFTPVCILKEEYVNNKHMYEFYGHEYPLHAPIEKWLLERYGEDWKVPKTEKGDWREDYNI